MNNQQRLLTLALLAAAEQSVIRGLGHDVHSFSCLHRQLFAGPLLVGERWDDGRLVQHPNLPLELTQVEKTRTFTTTVGLFLSSKMPPPVPEVTLWTVLGFRIKKETNFKLFPELLLLLLHLLLLLWVHLRSLAHEFKTREAAAQNKT